MRSAGRCAGLGLRVARDAHRCLPAAGPRATACTPSNEPEQRDYLRFVNFIIAPDFIVLLFVFVSAGLSVCGLYVSCRVSESVLVGTRGVCIESTSPCVIRVSYCENSERNTKKITPDYTTGRVGVPSFLRAGRQCAQTCTGETMSFIMNKVLIVFCS